MQNNGRKLLAFLLAAILLLCVTGCKGSSPTLAEPNCTEVPVISGINGTDHAGVAATVSGIYLYDKKTEILTVWQNYTDHAVHYTAAYTIERSENGQWVSCAKTQELSFIEIAYVLEPGRVENRGYDLTQYYDISVPGTYRFSADYYVHENEGSGEQGSLWAEFTVGT